MSLTAIDQETNILTVSQLNARIKETLEERFHYVWVQGEIANFRVPASGHFYFTLRDDKSQIRAVFFRNRQGYLKFSPRDGIQVLCQGRISVYPPRGDYQILVEIMEPLGRGALQLAFDQLKKKLHAEGLFDASRKRPLPLRPQRLAVLTSETGAAIRDILKTLAKGPYPVKVTLLPVPVQGDEAASLIAKGLDTVAELVPRYLWDVVIVGRGGGSLEDLWPFNEESVARAIARCPIPVISAVGHEIDYTIADFVADLRAVTPTAAAQLIVNRLNEIDSFLQDREETLRTLMNHRLQTFRYELRVLEKQLRDPGKSLEDKRLYLDDRWQRLNRSVDRVMQSSQNRYDSMVRRITAQRPEPILERARKNLLQLARRLHSAPPRIFENHRVRLQGTADRLEALNPLAVLSRGYAIVTSPPGHGLVTSSHQVQPGGRIGIRLAKGSLEATVDDVFTEPATTFEGE